MNKELLGFLFIFVAFFTGALYYTNTIQGPFISLVNGIKSSYLNVTTYIGEGIDEHFYQQETIQKLRVQNRLYEKNHLMMHQFANELNELFKENNTSLKLNPEVELVRALSYAKFGDTNKVWLQMHDFNSSKIYGLVHKELVAGIVISRHNKPLALLNGDVKSSYAVYVGEENAPGIVHGNNGKNLVLDFIPTWMKIRVGDEVETSGLDQLFFKGLKVGRVISISQAQGYQNAIVEPYFDATQPEYFHVIKEVR